MNTNICLTPGKKNAEHIVPGWGVHDERLRVRLFFCGWVGVEKKRKSKKAGKEKEQERGRERDRE